MTDITESVNMQTSGYYARIERFAVTIMRYWERNRAAATEWPSKSALRNETEGKKMIFKKRDLQTSAEDALSRTRARIKFPAGEMENELHA